jgi:hypothetical protein
MQSERVISDMPTFIGVLVKFGIADREQKSTKHQGYAEYRRVENDPVVTRIRERLRAQGKLLQRGGLFSNVGETEQAMSTMNDEQLLRLRARMVLNDFRLKPEDKGKEK